MPVFLYLTLAFLFLKEAFSLKPQKNRCLNIALEDRVGSLCLQVIKLISYNLFIFHLKYN